MVEVIAFIGEDRTKEDQGTIDVTPIEINVSQAKEIGETLQYNESTKETYAVTGYVTTNG